MPKYIDADVLKEAFLIEGKDVCDGTDEFDEKWGASQELIEKVIDSAPAVDMEPVVRCENCQFFEIVKYWPDGTKKVCQLLKRQVQENSFCCWGMKKEARRNG